MHLRGITKVVGHRIWRNVVVVAIIGLTSCTHDAGTCLLDPQNCLVQISNHDLEIIQVSFQKQNQMLPFAIDVEGGQEFHFCDKAVAYPISDSLIPMDEIAFIAVSVGKIQDDGSAETHSSFSFTLDSAFWHSDTILLTSETRM